MRAYSVTPDDRISVYDLPDRRTLTAEDGGVLGYISRRFFKGETLDVRVCQWGGKPVYVVIDDNGMSKGLRRNNIATAAYRLAHLIESDRGVVQGLALIIEKLSVHSPLAKDHSELDLDVDAALRGCTCDYCKYTFWKAGLDLRDLPSITCPECGRTTHHPKDIASRYCAACYVFWGEQHR